MTAKIRGILKVLWYKARYGKQFYTESFPRMENSARINLLAGTMEIGKGFSMKPNSYCAVASRGILRIGNNVSLNRNSMIICHDCITIGDRVAIGPNVAIYDHDHIYGMEGLESGYRTAPVVIERNCWIGAGVIILKGVHIGEGSVIGAGCVVKGNIPAHTVVKSNRELEIIPIADKIKLATH